MRVVFLLIAFCFGLYATPLHVSDSKEQIINQQIMVLEKDVSLQEAIQSEKFQEIPNSRRYLRQNLSGQTYWLKLPLLNVENNSLQKSLVFFWKNAELDLYYQKRENLEGPFALSGSNKTGVFSHNVVLEPKEYVHVYLHVKQTKLAQDFHELSLLNTYDVMDTLLERSSFYDNGYLLGMLTSILFFSIIMYLSTRRKSHFFFAIFIGLLIMIFSHYRWYLFEVFVDYPEHLYNFFRSSLPTMVIASLILFTQDFFNLKNKIPQLNLVLNIYLVIAVIAIFFPFYLLNRWFLEIGMPLIALTGLLSLKEYKYSALCFLLGILSITPMMFIHRIVDISVYYNFHQIMQICAVLCSFWISCATYINLKTLVQERIDYEKQSCVQSKFTVMGEVIANIAHQWRQPLNHLSSVVMNIEMHNENKALSPTILNKMLGDIKHQLGYMSSTIDDFMNFFSQQDKQENCSYKQTLEEIQSILHASLEHHQIALHVKVKKESTFEANSSKLKQVLMIILSNAMDALKDRPKDSREITVTIDRNCIVIRDNAGGIDKKIIDHIFEPYFTTKQEKHGTGLGLYTAKNLVEKSMNGTIKVENVKGGAQFSVSI